MPAGSSDAMAEKWNELLGSDEPEVEAEELEEEDGEESETLEQESEGDDDGGDELAALMARYGNDPKKVVKALASAQRALGKQGNELGALRVKAQLADQLLAGRQQKEEPQEQPEVLLAKTLRDRLEAGEDFIEPLLNGINEIVEARIRQATAPISETIQRDQGERVASEFFARHPDAKKFESEIVASMERFTPVLRNASSKAELMETLDMIYEFAAKKSGRKPVPIQKQTMSRGRSTRSAAATAEESEDSNALMQRAASGDKKAMIDELSRRMARANQRSLG